MKKTLLRFFLVVTVLASCFTASCSKKIADTIVFDNTHPLALAPDVSWAVVTEPYAAFRPDMNWEAEGEDYCRRGDILQVLGHSLDKKKNSWYRFEKGWLPSSCVSVYQNRLKAQTAANNLKG